MPEYRGGCLCGAVQIIATGKPDRVGICHCTDCRKHHGALFYAAAVFARDAVTLTGDTGEYQGRFFCPRCGSPVFARSGKEVEVHLGTLDNGDALVPGYELWARHRAGWLPPFAQMTSHPHNRTEDETTHPHLTRPATPRPDS